MTLAKRPAVRSCTAKRRYWRSAVCNCDSAKRTPRIASMKFSRLGGIAFDSEETGRVLSRRKYELRDSSTKGPSWLPRRSARSRPIPFFIFLNISADPLRERPRPRSDDIGLPVGVLTISVPQPLPAGRKYLLGLLMPSPSGRISSTSCPPSRRSWMILA